ncbi:hypothetical protein DL767_009675 [Monosporascus sp. MG133]|nr:hypothetical protein DL767_009675 [Monosporascus sp. MG133]
MASEGEIRYGNVWHASPLSEAQMLVIDSSYTPSADSATFAVVNPMRGERIYGCASATVEDYNRTIKSASVAFETWSRASPFTRCLVFLKAADVLEGYLQGDASAVLSAEVSATKELGPGEHRGHCGDPARVSRAGHAHQGQTERQPSPNMQCGTPWLAHQLHRQRSSRQNHRRLGGNMTEQCVLELGGKAPVLILDDANRKDAVEAVVFGGFSSAGQIRMWTKRVIVHTSLAARFK